MDTIPSLSLLPLSHHEAFPNNSPTRQSSVGTCLDADKKKNNQEITLNAGHTASDVMTITVFSVMDWN